jgi:hypothetical protein
MVADTCYSNTQEVAVERAQGLHSKTLSQKLKQKSC